MSAAACKVILCSNKAAASVETAKEISATPDAADAWRVDVAALLDSFIATVDAKISEITNPTVAINPDIDT